MMAYLDVDIVVNAVVVVDDDVLLLVLLAVVPGEVKRVTEFLLFGVEMVSHKVLKFVNEVLIVEVALNGQHGLEKSNVFAVHLDVLQEKRKIKIN